MLVSSPPRSSCPLRSRWLQYDVFLESSSIRRQDAVGICAVDATKHDDVLNKAVGLLPQYSVMVSGEVWLLSRHRVRTRRTQTLPCPWFLKRRAGRLRRHPQSRHALRGTTTWASESSTTVSSFAALCTIFIASARQVFYVKHRLPHEIPPVGLWVIGLGGHPSREHLLQRVPRGRRTLCRRAETHFVYVSTLC